MRLVKLNVSGIRNLHDVQLSLNPSFNLFYGVNGSGKTSLLEAIHLLGRGKSFRTSHLSSIINHNHTDCTVSGVLEADSGRRVRMGVNRGVNGQFNFRVDGSPAHSASRLAAELPLLLLNIDTFALLNGGPTQRRAYLDWIVFHVEQEMQALWKRYQRALKQRNNLLRHGKIDRLVLSAWDAEISTLAVEINEKRQRAAKRLFTVIPEVLARLGEIPEIEFSFYPGWNAELDLKEVLDVNLESDLRSRVTKYGPHRADIKIKVKGGVLAKEVLSRGQQKTLILAMQLSRGRLLSDVNNRKSLYLLDDLPAEFDKEHRLQVVKLFKEMKAQVLITGIESRDLLLGLEPPLGKEQYSLFHVEHGSIFQQQA